MDVLAGVSEESRRMITALEMTGGFRVLRRFQPLTKFADYESEQARAKAKLAMVVRSRATGSNPGRDKLLELGYVVVRFSAETGTVYEVDSVYAGTEAAAAVPEAALRAAGLTAQVVRGTAFDEARVNADAERCVVVICLNAETERHFLEARFLCSPRSGFRARSGKRRGWSSTRKRRRLAFWRRVSAGTSLTQHRFGRRFWKPRC